MARKRSKRRIPPEDRQGIRKETCVGCWRDCRRVDIARCPTTYLETKLGLKEAVASGFRTGPKAFITTNTVIGRMYEAKEQVWRRYINDCDKHGEDIPTTPQDLLDWAVALRPLQVRLALGVDRETALGMKTALKVRELKAYYELRLSTLPPPPTEPEVLELSPEQDDVDLPF